MKNKENPFIALIFRLYVRNLIDTLKYIWYHKNENKIKKGGVVIMATESILLDALRIPARYADEVLEAMESKKKVKKLDVDFEIVDDPEEIRKMFGYSLKDEE